MKNWIMMLLVIGMMSFANAVLAADCRILSVENTATDVWQIKVSLSNLPNTNPDSVPMATFFFRGQESPNERWIDYPASIVDGAGVVNLHWIAGDSIEFSYGVIVDGYEYWIDPTCSEYLYNGHFRIKLGEKKSPVILPFIPILLLKGGNPSHALHTCAIVNIEETAINGGMGDYKITLSLQKFTDAPAGAVPYVDRQQAPASAWTGWLPIARNGDVAILTVTGWPRGTTMEFSYKLVSSGTDYWQDIALWTGTCSGYVYNEHFRIRLGE